MSASTLSCVAIESQSNVIKCETGSAEAHPAPRLSEQEGQREPRRGGARVIDTPVHALAVIERHVDGAQSRPKRDVRGTAAATQAQDPPVGSHGREHDENRTRRRRAGRRPNSTWRSCTAGCAKKAKKTEVLPPPPPPHSTVRREQGGWLEQRAWTPLDSHRRSARVHRGQCADARAAQPAGRPGCVPRRSSMWMRSWSSRPRMTAIPPPSTRPRVHRTRRRRARQEAHQRSVFMAAALAVSGVPTVPTEAHLPPPSRLAWRGPPRAVGRAAPPPSDRRGVRVPRGRRGAAWRRLRAAPGRRGCG